MTLVQPCVTAAALLPVQEELLSLEPIFHSADTYALTYRLDQGGRLTRRLTIWRHDGARWRIVYHQGTVISGS